MRKDCVISTLVFAAALAVASNALAAAPKQVKVSFLAGKAEVTSKGATAPLKVGAVVSEGDTIVTSEGAKLELTLPDGSRVRLAPKTKVTISEGTFGADGKTRNVSVSMWVGRLWAKVAKSVGGSDSFEVETRNAVAGVRGTSFAVQASEDLSAVVRVYAGTVGVRKGEQQAQFGSKPPKERKRIAGPERIDKKQWEEIIATAMKQIKVTSLGEIAPAEDFEDQGEELEWAMWNKERDKVVR